LEGPPKHELAATLLYRIPTGMLLVWEAGLWLEITEFGEDSELFRRRIRLL